MLGSNVACGLDYLGELIRKALGMTPYIKCFLSRSKRSWADFSCREEKIKVI